MQSYKMSTQGIIASSNLFLLDTYQDLLYLNSNLTMTGKIIGISRKMQVDGLSHGFLMIKIENKSIGTELMKCNKK